MRPPPVPVQTSSVNWDAVARCESGGNWAINTGNGTTAACSSRCGYLEGPGLPDRRTTPPKSEQIRVAENVLNRQGIGAWPVWGDAPDQRAIANTFAALESHRRH